MSCILALSTFLWGHQLYHQCLVPCPAHVLDSESWVSRAWRNVMMAMINLIKIIKWYLANVCNANIGWTNDNQLRFRWLNTPKMNQRDTYEHHVLWCHVSPSCVLKKKHQNHAMSRTCPGRVPDVSWTCPWTCLFQICLDISNKDIAISLWLERIRSRILQNTEPNI